MSIVLSLSAVQLARQQKQPRDEQCVARLHGRKGVACDLGEGGEGWRALKQGLGGASAIVIWSTEDKRPHLFDDNSGRGNLVSVIS